jgi:hypothetical protein
LLFVPTTIYIAGAVAVVVILLAVFMCFYWTIAAAADAATAWYATNSASASLRWLFLLL